MFKRILFIFLFLPFAAAAQYHITGKVINLVDKKPVANASVFLSNASAGTKTNDDGTFTITSVRGGQYDLVVSNVAYATYKQTIAVNGDLILPDIGIIPQSIELKEVKIRPDKDWAKHYDMFREEFIGNSDYARQCKILNPKVIGFQYDKKAEELTANSSDFIEIENKALGYTVRYQLSDFSKNYKTSFCYYSGLVSFEEMKGSESQMKKWAKNRLKAYQGSSMHFLRSIISNQVAEQGFKVERLIRKPNPDYTGGFANKYIPTLVDQPLGINDYAKLTDQKGQYALDFKDCLYVMYNKKPEGKGATDLIPQYVISMLSIEGQYAYFDSNGVIINVQDVAVEGEWAASHVAELLPVDYEPK